MKSSELLSSLSWPPAGEEDDVESDGDGSGDSEGEGGDV